jgi:hypothetical protein
MRHHRGSGTRRQVAAQAFERGDHCRAFGSIDPSKGFDLELFTKGLQLRQKIGGFGGQKQSPRAAIGGIRTALDQVGFLQAVDHSAYRDGLDIEQFREFALINAFMPLEHEQHLPLCTRHSDRARARIERAAGQARNITKNCKRTFFHNRAFNKHSYKLQDLSNYSIAAGRDNELHFAP